MPTEKLTADKELKSLEPKLGRGGAKHANHADFYVSDEVTKTSAARELYLELKAQLFNNSGYLKLNLFTILWLFVGGSILGLVLETVFHAIVYGGWESRAGLVWGPFSPIYGVGAVALTVFLNRFYHSHNLVIFLVAMVLGSLIEYITSWGMEYFWGAIAWDYSNTFGSLNGRTNFAFGMMWGLLGLVWVRFALPQLKRIFARIDESSRLARILTVLLSLFMAANIIVSTLAVNRESQRAVGIPATTWDQKVLDEFFPDEYMSARMQNMSVHGKQEA